VSPTDEQPSEKPAGKGNLSLPKKLFDSNEEIDSIGDEDLKKSPIITYKRRIPQSRSSELRGDKRLKPSSPLKSLNSPQILQPAMCSTPLSVKAKPPLIPQSPIVDSEDDDSLLFELCDEIEKSVQKEGGSVSSCPKEKPKEKVQSANMNFGGFSTASGAKITISEEASKAAEGLFAMFMAEDIPEEDEL
jgi:hypothetical protein